MKKCSKCSIIKANSKFTPSKRYTSGLSSQCKDCGRSYADKHRNDPEQKRKNREKWLRSQYGITLEQYELLSELQDGVCYICKHRPGKYPLNVDHEHSSGYIRGLLCQRCNRGLGFIGDNLDRARNAVEYLEEFEQRKLRGEDSLYMVPKGIRRARRRE